MKKQSVTILIILVLSVGLGTMGPTLAWVTSNFEVIPFDDFWGSFFGYGFPIAVDGPCELIQPGGSLPFVCGPGKSQSFLANTLINFLVMAGSFWFVRFTKRELIRMQEERSSS